jgi:hypothetical protein
MTADGATVIGYTASANGDTPFRWNALDGIDDLGARGQPRVVSDDGATIAGVTTTSQLRVDVFRWTAAELLAVAPAALSEIPDIDVVRLSADGAVVAGTSSVSGASAVFRFSTQNGLLLLDGVRPAIFGDMTPDGDVIVGSASGESFRWRRTDGGGPEPAVSATVETFSSLQAASGVDLTGWALGRPTTVSDDGAVVFGRGQCGTVPTIYRWVLPR